MAILLREARNVFNKYGYIHTKYLLLTIAFYGAWLECIESNTGSSEQL